MSKYKAKKTTVDNIVFDSKKEATRYTQLMLLERAGKICNLKRQIKYELIPSQYVNGKCVERAVTYTADFEYDEDGHHIVEDAKGMRTQPYILRRKLMLWVHGIRIRET